ncbi:MAG: sugar transferase [Paludibacteraceae bacterium]|nr:sugar transferase [Paludibacteraceae bacterium]
MSNRSKWQLIYLLTDILSAVLVWLCFLLFRWLVYEGRIFSVETVLIPAFSFYRPLLLYPAACVVVHYLSGFYLRPLKHNLARHFLTTLCSAAIIALGAFFVIIIDDKVSSYELYLWSLLVLFSLQFTINYLSRLAVTLYQLSHINDITDEPIVIDLPDDATEQDLFTRISEAYPTGKEIILKPRMKDILTGAARISDLQSEAMIVITDQHMSDSQICIKRAFDVIASAAVLVIGSPIYILLALLIKVTSKGTILYRQERIGLHGLPFDILKFRTMYEDAEQGTPRLADDNDQRVTPIGHFLRKYRLDELPQMWNVLKGDMSVVGPRPERPYFISLIEQQAPYYCLIYKIRPGLTSWGPIKVGYTDTIDKMIQRLKYDIAYMENMSIGLDIKIMFYTLGVLLNGKGK